MIGLGPRRNRSHAKRVYMHTRPMIRSTDPGELLMNLPDSTAATGDTHRAVRVRSPRQRHPDLQHLLGFSQ